MAGIGYQSEKHLDGMLELIAKLRRCMSPQSQGGEQITPYEAGQLFGFIMKVLIPQAQGLVEGDKAMHQIKTRGVAAGLNTRQYYALRQFVMEQPTLSGIDDPDNEPQPVCPASAKQKRATADTEARQVRTARK